MVHGIHTRLSSLLSLEASIDDVIDRSVPMEMMEVLQRTRSMDKRLILSIDEVSLTNDAFSLLYSSTACEHCLLEGEVG